MRNNTYSTAAAFPPPTGGSHVSGINGRAVSGWFETVRVLDPGATEEQYFVCPNVYVTQEIQPRRLFLPMKRQE